MYRHAWMTLFSGFFEPLFYLFSLGVGLGHFVGKVHGVSYASYIAPALLASAAMNGAIYDATTNVFWKLRYGKVYDSMLATPLGPIDVAVGETAWAQFRGALYATGFVVTAAALGLLHSWWALLALPAAMVVGFGFAGIGIAASTFLRTGRTSSWCRSFSCRCSSSARRSSRSRSTRSAIQWFVRFSPLYHAITLIRSLTLGTVGPINLLNAAYLLVLGVVGIAIARRRMAGLLLT